MGDPDCAGRDPELMDSKAGGQVGGLECDKNVRERMAKESGSWRCPGCAKSNAEILRENEEACAGTEAQEEVVPEELRLAYREDLGGEADKTDGAAQPAPMAQPQAPASSSSSSSQPPPAPAPAAASTPGPTPTIPPAVPALPARPNVAAPLIQHRTAATPQWLDTAIYGVAAALVFMVLKKTAS